MEEEVSINMTIYDLKRIISDLPDDMAVDIMTQMKSRDCVCEKILF